MVPARWRARATAQSSLEPTCKLFEDRHAFLCSKRCFVLSAPRLEPGPHLVIKTPVRYAVLSHKTLPFGCQPCFTATYDMRLPTTLPSPPTIYPILSF